MTENNAAQAAGKILTYLGFAQAMSMEPGADRRRDHIQSLIESTLLSKLRAEGMQAGDEEPPPIIPDDEEIAGACINASDIDGIAYDGQSFERGYRAALASTPVADTLPLEKALYELLDKIAPGLDTGNLVQDARRASNLLGVIMASAPVAGEAQAVHQVFHSNGTWEDISANELSNCEENGKEVRTLYAVHQASEAVRILFPAHLRKMWSGGEVQTWLDEHQGITPPNASAKGSLEHYRKWQAEKTQADKDGCANG
ncbi:hypothetical protein C4E15_14485 [Achromobacter spanius]|uniref:Uncharacterized protein n=1 Tax=Achromobacter spanius TaxID=217203 RepID=A0A2S5GQV1_9BURK|nr:hypothetical protein [Achromobacter spanius]PPA75316.1 hypothetical protein C4E15_14485 [Achromobacter spanius]